MATDNIRGTRWSKLPDPSKYDIGEVKKDVKAGLKALNPPETAKGSALEMVERAGLRGGSRLLGAAGEAAGALGAGYLVGRGIDNTTGLGKDLVNKTSLGKKVDEFVNDRDQVELSKEAKDRIAAGELEENVSSRPVKRNMESESSEGGGGTARSIPRDRTLMENREPKDGAMKRGGKVVKSPKSKKFDGIAAKGHTKGRMI
jgi:hypothetical protein